VPHLQIGQLGLHLSLQLSNAPTPPIVAVVEDVGTQFNGVSMDIVIGPSFQERGESRDALRVVCPTDDRGTAPPAADRWNLRSKLNVTSVTSVHGMD
jgi:hypothetical protein